jgi:hypothetical protein
VREYGRIKARDRAAAENDEGETTKATDATAVILLASRYLCDAADLDPTNITLKIHAAQGLTESSPNLLALHALYAAWDLHRNSADASPAVTKKIIMLIEKLRDRMTGIEWAESIFYGDKAIRTWPLLDPYRSKSAMQLCSGDVALPANRLLHCASRDQVMPIDAPEVQQAMDAAYRGIPLAAMSAGKMTGETGASAESGLLHSLPSLPPSSELVLFPTTVYVTRLNDDEAARISAALSPVISRRFFIFQSTLDEPEPAGLTNNRFFHFQMHMMQRCGTPETGLSCFRAHQLGTAWRDLYLLPVCLFPTWSLAVR